MATTNGIGSFQEENSGNSSSGYFSSSHPRDAGDGSKLSQGKRQKLKELVRPLFQESYFTAEYCLLGAVQCNQPTKMSGLYAIPSAQSPFHWFGVIFIRDGYWQGGVFRFTLKFPDHFPDAGQQNNLPAIQFTGAFPKNHPLIHRGVFDIKRFHRTYHRTNNHVWQLLKCTRKIFYKFEVLEKNVYPNKNAAELYLKDLELFKKKCESDVQNSLAKIYEEESSDANFIRFSKDLIKRDTSLNGIEVIKNSAIGLSWME